MPKNQLNPTALKSDTGKMYNITIFLKSEAEIAYSFPSLFNQGPLNQGFTAVGANIKATEKLPHFLNTIVRKDQRKQGSILNIKGRA